MTKKKLTTKNSTRKTSEAKFVFDDYKNYINGKSIPINSVWIDALAAELCKWAIEDESALRLNQFLKKKGMLATEFMRLVEKHPKLKDAYAGAMAAIADRREIGWINNQFNSAAIHSSLAHYCEVAKSQSEWRSQLKNEAQGEGITKILTVMIPEIPASKYDPPSRKLEEKGAYEGKENLK